MKNIALSFCLYFVITFINAQNNNVVKEINQLTPPSAALEPLRFLAADELMGRASTRPEINIAARYISESFKSLGLKEVKGTQNYFQTFEFKMKKPAAKGSFVVNGTTYETGNTLLQVKGEDITVTAPIVYVKHGMESDLANIDVKGRIVITESGSDNSGTFRQNFFILEAKQKVLQEKGAIAVIERFRQNDISWSVLQRYLTKENAGLEESINIPVFIAKDDAGSLKNTVDNNTGTLTISDTQIRTVPARNIMGWVEGTDAKLKNQYIVLSAHYDHLGVAERPKMEEGKMDSIYNGARDNAIGVTAVMNAARYFAQHPPKRSILFIAYTAEEVGEIGSRYFSQHPTFPLKQMVYNLNIDNASYNDTSIITVIGLGRTSADNDIKKACAAYRLTAKPDPAPEQDLFDRSDNVNLAVHGIPAPNFSLGISRFDNEIMKRYHQLSDEVSNFDLDYAMKYIRSFILTAKYIADNPKQPEWVKGDKYEAAWKNLYQ